LDLDWISFAFQPDPEPDYPNEIHSDHRKNLKNENDPIVLL